MKLRLLILLAAAALAATPAAGQTIKSLGYNTTNGQVVYSGTNPLTFTNPLAFGNTTNTASVRNNLGLGASNAVTFGGLTISADQMLLNGASIESVGFGGQFNFEERQLFQNGATVFGWDTNSFTVYPPATFNTNVTVNGSLSVGSLTTTTPSTWALDATQTAAGTNGVLDLPLTANVLRITNANTISAITNGRLGAFYFLLNQSGTNLVISNSATITARGATNLTLGANQSATLISTTATNATVH